MAYSGCSSPRHARASTMLVHKKGRQQQMKTAVFVETYAPIMGADKRQILMVPHADEVNIYMRLTDGQKGLSNKWTLTEWNDLDIDENEHITKMPVGVRVTVNDEADIQEKGYSPVLGVKAINAHNKAGEFDEPDADVKGYLEHLLMHVSLQDSVVDDMVIDNRTKSETAPFITAPTQTSTPVVEESVREHAMALATVPRREVHERYVSRKVFGLQDYEVFDRCRAKHIDGLIYGPTGPGKTTSVLAWAASRGLRVATVSGNAALEPSHLIGKYIPDENNAGRFIWVDGPVTDVVRNGGVLILDEVNFISPKIYTVLYSLLDARRALILLDHKGETVEAHKDLTIFATMNPSYTGTVPLNFAFRNRFAMQLFWDYDDKVEAKLINSGAILTIAKQLRSEAAKGEFETPISTNMLMELEEFISTFNYEFAIENFINHFDLEEQDKVRLVFTTHESNIRADFEEIKVELVEKEEDQSTAQATVQA